MKHILFATTVALGLITTSFARADYAAERAYLEKEIDQVCSNTIGARYNSEAYYDCRSYYDRRFYDYGYDWDHLTAEQVSEFLNVIHPFVDRCRHQGLVSTLLWGCIRDYGDEHYRDWSAHHPGFRPEHAYHPHFEKRPAPKPEHMGGPHSDRKHEMERPSPHQDRGEPKQGPKDDKDPHQPMPRR